ncbi:hypothetical protein F970_01777 [Acinetobacter sp. CIP 102082]|uniref:hypothetical protein n=1 Tax=Acinetobacter TaxID=469 RepID=UPI0002CDC0D2|nr:MULTISPECIES: hypothetical protein [Acinetobacter]ENU88003.1 hypothetical protein F972_02520 [Acinetobacter sp. CIP 102529]ENU95316.1 hypothetical protein F970_01777 [Acinetobacter sp. CIP 102082]ENX69830.1 hypothetical protein F884_00544 [Acinetobacter sp. CIP 102143]MCU4394725.1 hypothetical protein [Acinetobacter parvus]
MLPTKLLKLRLSRIAKGKEHLSTQDKLILVSMESPDLSTNFFLRLFKMSLPKQWKFRHETEEDILYSTQLIQLVEDEFIPAYETHARKYAWYEQCLMYRLNFITPQPTQQQINLYLRQLDLCLDQQPKLDLLHHFQQKYPSAQHAVALAKSYAGAGQYTQAITQYEWAPPQSTQRNEVAFYGYIDCLLKRNQPEYKSHLSDVEYAVELLNQYGKVIDQKTHAMLLQRAVSLLLPANILQKRATETNILADVGRGLNSLGKSLGGILGGRELHLPYSQEVIASAPQLLMDQIIVASLVHSNNMQAALKRILNPENDSTITQDNAEQQLGRLWLAVQANPDILKLLNQPEQLTTTLTNTEALHESCLNLGSIQTILEQGLMAYLGDIRLDKHHPERTALYEQRDVVVAEMTAFAQWFHQDVLKTYLEQQTKRLQQLQGLLSEQTIEGALSSGLFAYQFEQQQRAQGLFNWMQQKLEKGNDFYRMQAAWVALREIVYFQLEEAKEKIELLQQALEKYKTIRLEQVWVRPEQPETTSIKEDEK